MFETRRTIGLFQVTTSRDSLHRRRRNAERREDFIDEWRAKQKGSIKRSFNETPIREVYRRALGQCPSISMDVRRQQGKPCLAGTRVPVHLVLWAIEQSGSIAGALKSYPDLSAQQVKDALYFAETILGSPNVITEAAPTA
ncbi:MAG TPA: DUF433 domain-containing protein [Bryobacteraceae bacterium]|jgi:uncharacterized protein (DUF433 family)|nr:DUF433 domain-containing protein [Bryobacteraceae bacterium]